MLYEVSYCQGFSDGQKSRHCADSLLLFNFCCCGITLPKDNTGRRRFISLTVPWYSPVVSGQEPKASLLLPSAERACLPNTCVLLLSQLSSLLRSPGQPMKWCCYIWNVTFLSQLTIQTVPHRLVVAPDQPG